METRLSKKRKLESQEEKNTLSTSLLDLPMEMLIYLGQLLELKHILRFRCYSRYSREVGNTMLSHRRELTITNTFPRKKTQVRLILKQCHNLRKICIVLNYKKGIITDEIIENLLINNPLLEEIELWICDGIASKAMMPLATQCKNLVKLIIRGFYPGNDFLETFSAHNNHLVEVKFDYSVIFRNELENIWEFLKNQPKLQRISLPSTHLSSKPKRFEIYEKILFTIAEVCKELTYLGNLRAKINAMRKIVENCPKLNRIVFAYDEGISDDMYSYLHSKGIQVIGGCSESDLDSDSDCGYGPYWRVDSPPQYYDPDRD